MERKRRSPVDASYVAPLSLNPLSDKSNPSMTQMEKNTNVDRQESSVNIM